MSVVGFAVPKEVVEDVYQTLEKARSPTAIRKGTNEATKAIERGLAKLVVIAEDVEPKEIVMHIPMICKEKKVPYISVPSKKELGASVGVDVQTAAVAVVDDNKAKKEIEALAKKIKDLQK